jgi:hypothetical protein
MLWSVAPRFVPLQYALSLILRGIDFRGDVRLLLDIGKVGMLRAHDTPNLSFDLIIMTTTLTERQERFCNGGVGLV